jgi:hypothetical protein
MDNHIIREIVHKKKLGTDTLHEWTNAKEPSKPTYV